MSINKPMEYEIKYFDKTFGGPMYNKPLKKHQIDFYPNSDINNGKTNFNNILNSLGRLYDIKKDKPILGEKEILWNLIEFIDNFGEFVNVEKMIKTSSNLSNEDFDINKVKKDFKGTMKLNIIGEALPLFNTFVPGAKYLESEIIGNKLVSKKYSIKNNNIQDFKTPIIFKPTDAVFILLIMKYFSPRNDKGEKNELEYNIKKIKEIIDKIDDIEDPKNTWFIYHPGAKKDENSPEMDYLMIKITNSNIKISIGEVKSSPSFSKKQCKNQLTSIFGLDEDKAENLFNETVDENEYKLKKDGIEYKGSRNGNNLLFEKIATFSDK